MLIIGCDFHTRFQQIAMLDSQTGEIVQRRLEHESGEAKTFYAALPVPAPVEMEATGYPQHAFLINPCSVGAQFISNAKFPPAPSRECEVLE